MSSTNQITASQSAGPPPRGMVALGVVVCLVVATVIVLGWVKTMVQERRQLRNAELRLQAQWLIESALDRVAAKLAAKPDYTGETWNIAAGELSGRDAAMVQIQVAAAADHPEQRLVQITADYPAELPERVRLERQVAVRVGPGQPAEKGN